MRGERAGCAAAVLLPVCTLLSAQAPAQPAAQLRHPLRIVTTRTEVPAPVEMFRKLELDFSIEGRHGTMTHWPYDEAPPRGIPARLGISVDAVFRDPDGKEYRQPAFYYQHFQDQIRNRRDWNYPTTDFVWKVRFSPNRAGTWKYRIVAQDRSGKSETDWRTFTVTAGSGRGFVRVSRADSRYFEFDDGSLFSGLGFQVQEFLDDPITRGGPAYQSLQTAGISFARLWLSSLYGSAWNPYLGGRNRYAGYLPVAGLMPVRGTGNDAQTLAMRLDYERTGDSGWFDACRLQSFDDPEPVKPNTRYRVRATYVARRIVGPRNPRFRQYGFVLKLGGMFPNCHEPGTSRPVTSYGTNTSDWGTVQGEWFSGRRFFLPKLHLALENAVEGQVYTKAVSVREVLPDGTEGPEILARPSTEHHLYIPQARAHAFDQILSLAERHGVYLKLVVMEKSDEIYTKIADDGSFVSQKDNLDGVYGTGRVLNKTRWLQQAWWRYLQARWGYSPNIHSWELLNEGDPASKRHFELADEFGKYMHYGVFGVKPSASFDHPNDHLITTSFWHSFPATEFWANPSYPHVDYADVHAYVSTSFAPPVIRQRMQWDAAFYHIWHSQAVARARIGKPVVRGEAGLDPVDRQDDTALGIQHEVRGVWLHNFLWSGLHSGGLYELYWWRSHIWNSRADHRATYRLIALFLSDLQLNRGGYQDWEGSVSTNSLRVVGQKNLRTNKMHLWIQNVQHTWKNVLDGRAILPVSGELRVSGFRPESRFRIEWWSTYDLEQARSPEIVNSDRNGQVLILVPNVSRDIALKFSPIT